MRASVPLLTVVGTAVGAVAAIVAYQAGAGGAAKADPSGKDQVPETSAVAPTAAKPTFLPCKKGTKLRKGVCVRVKKQVVVVYDPAPAAPAAPAVAPLPATSARSGDDSGEGRTRARPEPGERAGGDDRHETGHSEDHESETEHSEDHESETEHSEDHESADSDEVEAHHAEDGPQVESDD